MPYSLCYIDPLIPSFVFRFDLISFSIENKKKLCNTWKDDFCLDEMYYNLLGRFYVSDFNLS